MDPSEQELFLQNFQWFNQFFLDVKQLLDMISEALLPTLQAENPGFYYPKANYYPSLPPYLLMGIGGFEMALQTFIVFEPETIGNSKIFSQELSLFFVLFAGPENNLYPNGYGWSVIPSSTQVLKPIGNNIFAGNFPRKPDMAYYIFQVSLSQFLEGKDTKQAIQVEIVERVNSTFLFLQEN